MQSSIVAVVVLACCVYSTWTLMPAALRRCVAVALVRNPWLARWTPLLRAAKPAGMGCASCGGCDKGAATAAISPAAASARPAVSVIRIVARQRA